LERTIVRPAIVVAMGATAIRSVSGRPLAINKIRGRVMSLADGGHMLATIHPSYLLRIEDDVDNRAQYRRFVADLRACKKFLTESAVCPRWLACGRFRSRNEGTPPRLREFLPWHHQRGNFVSEETGNERFQAFADRPS